MVDESGKNEIDSENNSENPEFKDPRMSRRQFVVKMSIFFGGVAALFTGTSIASLRFVSKNKKNIRTESNDTSSLVELGDLSDFSNITDTKIVEYSTEIEDAWVKRNIEGHVYVAKDINGEFLIMSPICTHLGCNVHPATEEQKKAKSDMELFCPCHGGEYDELGNNIGGPPPRPLDLYQPIVRDDKLYFNYNSLTKREK